MSGVLRLPKWHKELDTYRSFCTTFIIEGNVHDLQAMINVDTDQYRRVSLKQYLKVYFSEKGYKYVGFYNRIEGFADYEELQNTFRGVIKSDLKCMEKDEKSLTVDEAITIIRKASENTAVPCVFVIDLAFFLHSDPSRLEENEIEKWGTLFLTSLDKNSAKYEDEEPLNNLLVLITDKLNDIPTWFYLNNPNCKVIHITKPNKDIRKRLFIKNANFLRDYEILNGRNEIEDKADVFANLTEGLTNIELDGVLTLCQERDISITQIQKAIDLFKYGEKESRWDSIDREKIKEANSYLNEAIVGQTAAVRKVTDVLYRSISGLSGIQSSSYGHPKGVLFFAGPTGTGKTEMAKKIARLIFDDENAITRFDMSEYNLEHSNQKLIGAPPGYVGYAAGGQLTNAIKENPFSVLLFDEIDKAHPRIMDTFLQILEDGRVTDSAGETVYFSECVIIFTSNVGMSDKDSNNPLSIRYPYEITTDDSYEEIEKKLKSNVEFYFKYINRREIYNRIGDNVVVFDYIRQKESEKIFKKKLDHIICKLKETKAIVLDLSENCIQNLLTKMPIDSEYGGRVVVAYLESNLVNPISRYLVLHNLVSDVVIHVEDISETGDLQCTFERM